MVTRLRSRALRWMGEGRCQQSMWLSLKLLPPLKASCGAWGTGTKQARTLPPGTAGHKRPLEGMGTAQQRPHVAASRAAASGLPVLPHLLFR